MQAIRDSSGNIIASRYLSVMPRKDAIKIEHRLLNGNYHYQTIGQAGSIVELQFIINESGKEIIDQHEAICAPIIVETSDKGYVGIIREVPRWELIFRGNRQTRLYRGTCAITVQEEGVV